jgi:hypothetical protein
MWPSGCRPFFRLGWRRAQRSIEPTTTSASSASSAAVTILLLMRGFTASV